MKIVILNDNQLDKHLSTRRFLGPPSFGVHQVCQLIPMLGASGFVSSCVSWLAKRNVQQEQQSQSLSNALNTYTLRSWEILLIVPASALSGLRSITFPIYLYYFLRLTCSCRFSSATCLLSSVTAGQRTATRRE